MTNVVANCNLRLFADDTCLFIEVDNRKQGTLKLNEDLKIIQKWSLDWLIKNENLLSSFKALYNIAQKKLDG